MASTTLMFDAVTPSRIPNPKLVRAVLIYIDGRYAWTGADLALFPDAAKVRIACLPSTDDGRVLDVETGDATPEQAPQWVANRRKSTQHPLAGPATIYTSLSNWQTVREAFVNEKIAEPEWLIAHYDNVACIPAGAIGKQYESTPGYDVSIVETSWLA